MAGRRALPDHERTVVVSFRLRPDEVAELRRHAELTGQGATEVIRKAVRLLLADDGDDAAAVAS